MFDILFNTSPQNGNLASRKLSKTKFTNHLDFLAYKLIYFYNDLPKQIKNRNSVKEKAIN